MSFKFKYSPLSHSLSKFNLRLKSQVFRCVHTSHFIININFLSFISYSQIQLFVNLSCFEARIAYCGIESAFHVVRIEIHLLHYCLVKVKTVIASYAFYSGFARRIQPLQNRQAFVAQLHISTVRGITSA